MFVVLPQQRHLGLETIALGLAARALIHVCDDRGIERLSHGQARAVQCRQDRSEVSRASPGSSSNSWQMVVTSFRTRQEFT